MSEIKRTFQGGKMNKDLDERIVPNGEYRDALNIQIRTSDGDAVGTVQNLKSTYRVWNGVDKNDPDKSYYRDWMGDTNLNINGEKSLPEIIGSVTDEKNDKIYFFIKAPHLEDTIKIFEDGNYDAVTMITSERKFNDCILEYNVNTNSEKAIAVDNFAIINTFAEINPTHPLGDTFLNGDEVETYTRIDVSTSTGGVNKYRPGMTIKAVKSNGTNVFPNGEVVRIKSYKDGAITLYGEHTKNIFNSNIHDITHFIFEHDDRPLNFSNGDVNNSINAINVIDNLLFWTDNTSEPKKINIDRSREGSDGFYTHTKLCVTNPATNNYQVVTTQVDSGLLDYRNSPWLKEEHVTVIRKAPTYAPTLHMKRTHREGLNNSFLTETYIGINSEGNDTAVDDIIVITNDIWLETVFFFNDIIVFNQFNNSLEEPPVQLKAKFLCYEDTDGNCTCSDEGDIDDSDNCEVTNRVRFQMIAIDPGLTEHIHEWKFHLELEKPLYELKMGRFGLRYKYEDGEYSSFGPWSELAFLPDDYDYQSRRGYNLGMVNSLRELVIKDFIPYPRPLDVVGVDILWKSTDSPSVYVMSTVERAKDSEWEEFTTDTSSNDIKTGELHITSEMIHKVVPSDQILRSWDNVPRRALAQEIVGNRLLYGNYVQGYDFKYPVSLTQNIISDTTPSLSNPQKSIKTIRDYKFGMVFGDKYGRETPVMTSGYVLSQNDIDNPYIALTGDVSVPKILSAKKNSIELRQVWTNTINSLNVPHDWIDYVKYYVKEPTNEYYNLIMDHWYWAEDEQRNVWLSFNSADRNKVDEETHLILKNKHNSQRAVLEKARYKILAIENDVPEYVKNVQLDLGKCPMTEAANGITVNNLINSISLETVMWDQCSQSVGISTCSSPTDGLTTKKLYVGVEQWNIFTGTVLYDWDSGEFHESGQILHPLGKEIEGTIKLRIRGKHNNKYLYTRWQNVSSWRVINADMEYAQSGEWQWLTLPVIEFSFSEPFGEEIDMYTRWKNIVGEENLETGSLCCAGNFVIPDLEYFIELREDIPEHKAQYDGKFFAKVEADGVMLSNIIGSSSQSQQYVVKRSYPVHYVSSNRNGNLGQEISGTYTGFGDGWNNADFDSGNPVPFFGMFPSSDNGITVENIQSEFGGISDGEGEGSCLNFFQDGLEYPEAVQTKEYWEYFRTQASETHGGGDTFNNIVDTTFLDDARMVYGHLPTSDWVDEDNSTPEGGGPYTPTSFDTGILENNDGTFGAQSGVGRMTLSYLGDEENGQPHPGALKNDLKQVGALFRWAGDPYNEENIYQVIAVDDDDSDLSGEDINGYGANYVDSDCSNCNTANMSDGNVGACHRRTYQVEFRKIELFTNELTSEGMPITQWDPRSNMDHWGGEYQVLDIVELRSVNSYSSGEIRDGAVWETEPKKSTELDIYYEASDAIPVTLNENNIYNFAPIDSSIGAWRSSSDGWTNLNIGNAYNYRSWIGDENKDQAFVHIRKFDSDADAWVNCGDLEESDEVTFTHNNGTITRTKITGVGKYSIDSYDEDSLNSTLVVEPQWIEVENSASYSDIGTEFDVQLYFSGSQSETTTVVNPNDSSQTKVVPKIYITRQSVKWPKGGGAQECVAAGQDELGELPITSYEVYDDAEGDFSSYALSNGYNNGLPLDTKVTITEVVTDVASGSFITTDDDGVIVAPNATDQNQFDPTNTFSFTNAAWLEVKLSYNDYDLFPTDTTGSPDPEADDYNSNYGNYRGVIWNLSRFSTAPTGIYAIDTKVWKYPIILGWHNCYSFGNGAESDRIRDDYNAPQIDNGVKVSTTFSGYSEETKGSGMIYSGLYNSISEVNDLNEFNISQKITKNLNPAYGSIQALKTRDTDVVVLAEDKVLKVLASKDALYNADGNPQLTATDKVLGTAVPFVGDYGISQNPESLAWDQFRLYFTDKQRGAVLRLSRDGLTPISNVGMRTWFRENLPNAQSLLGTFDTVNGEYNLTLHTNSEDDDKTISFNEGAKGWISFKSFIPNAGESVSGKYITAYKYEIWDHYNKLEDTYSTFYGTEYESSIKLIFNDLPGSIKSFKTINYEGSQSKIDEFATINQDGLDYNDGEYYNISGKKGWYVDSFETDLQSGSVPEFINKEGKWFNKINGIITETSNIDTSEFTVQGIGDVTWIYNYDVDSGDDGVIPDATIPGCTDPTACNYDNQATITDYSCVYPEAGYDCDGNCLSNYNDFDDGNGCVEIVYGCTDNTYVEYNPLANTCTPLDTDGDGVIDVQSGDADGDGVCDDCVTPITYGCMDPNACNSGDYLYPENTLCFYEADCNGDCGGTAVETNCGCGQPEAETGYNCDGTCASGYQLDEYGICVEAPDDQIWSISNYTDDSLATIEGVCPEGQVWDADQGICVDG